ncbi:MAG: SMC-Scp complex subunit ScpB [Planctomycetes bacterium]|nr:SMC-Scp complex subunit ScpB [Planctomycetota bacterium]
MIDPASEPQPEEAPEASPSDPADEAAVATAGEDEDEEGEGDDGEALLAEVVEAAPTGLGMLLESASRSRSLLDGVVTDLRRSERKLEQSLEALLVSTRVPLTADDIALKLGLPVDEVHAGIERLRAALDGRALGLFPREKNGQRAYVVDVRAAYRPDVASVAPPLLKPLVTETLALIAINQPIAQARLVRERGSTVYEHVKELLERGLVQRGKQGRSYTLRTTDAFAAEFGLPNDPDLIRQALARAAGALGDPGVIGSQRLHFDAEGAPDALVLEANRIAEELGPPPPELLAPLLGTGEEGDAAPATPSAAPQARQELPDLGPLPRLDDCVISGGEAPSARVAEPSEPEPTRGPAAAPQEAPMAEAPSPTPESSVTESSPPRADSSRLERLLSLTDDQETTLDDW